VSQTRARIFVLALAASAVGCTDAGLFAIGAGGPSGPDRAELAGTACVPLSSSDAFPVKVLFAFQGGDRVDPLVKTGVVDSLNSMQSRFPQPFISFGVIAFHTVASGLQGTYVAAADLGPAIAKYSGYQESGPDSLRAPLELSRSIISGDMQSGCRGSVARTRYLVVLVMTSADSSCANPSFNPGLDTQTCGRLASPELCSACELERSTETVKQLAQKWHAGEVTIQPVYVRTVADTAARFQGAAIARAGGTTLIETDPGNLKNALNALNYASLQRQLKLKRLVAFNQNTIVRDGVILVDTDGDGIPDEEESIDPIAGSTVAPKLDPDSDDDAIRDGIERRMGLDPLGFTQVNGCNPTADTDQDRLNDCEERVLGTDPCISDTDGDGLPDIVELNVGTNPLIPEDLNDSDRDGLLNIDEALRKTDPESADIAFQQERGYGYAVSEVEPTDDGRSCYDISAYNITLVETERRPNAPYPDILQGSNDVFLYFQVGRENDPRGSGVGTLFFQRIQFLKPNLRKPKGTVRFVPDDFILGF
jgi:Bacterial TSP3 repeat